MSINAITSIAASVPEPVLFGVIGTLAAAVAAVWRFYANRITKLEDARITEAHQHAVERERIAGERAVEREQCKAQRQADFATWEIERKELEVERAVLREQMERQHREVLEDALARDEMQRKDFAERIERIASEASKAAQSQVDVLNKLYDRFLGPRRAR